MDKEKLRNLWLNYPGEGPSCLMLDGSMAILINGPSDSAAERNDWNFGFQVPGEENIRWRNPEQIDQVGDALMEIEA